MRKATAVVVLLIALSAPTYAGEIPYGYTAPPPPPERAQTTTSTGQTVLESALTLVRSLLGI